MFILCPSVLGISYLGPGYVTIASSLLKGGGKKREVWLGVRNLYN